MKEKIIWQAGRKEGVYDAIRIPGIVVTKAGTILAYAEARDYKNIIGKGYDWAAIDVIMKRSTDGGESWSKTEIIGSGTNPNDSWGYRTVGNPVMIVDSGNIHMLYCVCMGLDRLKKANNAGVFYIKSVDDGLTWSAPRDISDCCHTDKFPRSLIATVAGHGITLSKKSRNSDMLLVPVWMTSAAGGNDMAHHPSVTSVLYSLNHGETWQMGDFILNTEELPDPNETVAVELSDGRVMLNIRHTGKNKRRAVSVSETGYSNFSTPHFDKALIDPTCFGSSVRYDKNTILFVNCADDITRTKLTIRVSRDNGETWEASRIIVSGTAGYSDIAVGADGMIYVLYEIDYGTVSMNLLSFPLDWVYNSVN